MKETPLLYSTPMVKAKLAGRKTVTRRTRSLNRVNIIPERWGVEQIDTDLFRFWYGVKNAFVDIKSPYGKNGDIIWGRETWQKSNDHNGEFSHYIYLADGDPLHSHIKWKPSIHMPKAASRIWERVIDVRVERLHDISEEDCIAEGVFKYGPFGEYAGSPHPNGGMMKHRAYGNAIDAYRCIWESINGPGSWEVNPWVWRIETEVLSTTGKPEVL